MVENLITFPRFNENYNKGKANYHIVGQLDNRLWKCEIDFPPFRIEYKNNILVASIPIIISDELNKAIDRVKITLRSTKRDDNEYIQYDDEFKEYILKERYNKNSYLFHLNNISNGTSQVKFIKTLYIQCEKNNLNYDSKYDRVILYKNYIIQTAINIHENSKTGARYLAPSGEPGVFTIIRK